MFFRDTIGYSLPPCNCQAWICFSRTLFIIINCCSLPPDPNPTVIEILYLFFHSVGLTGTNSLFKFIILSLSWYLTLNSNILLNNCLTPVSEKILAISSIRIWVWLINVLTPVAVLFKLSASKPWLYLVTPVLDSLTVSKYSSNGKACWLIAWDCIGNITCCGGCFVLTIPPGLDVNKSSRLTIPSITATLLLFVKYILSNNWRITVDLTNCTSSTNSSLSKSNFI